MIVSTIGDVIIITRNDIVTTWGHMIISTIRDVNILDCNSRENYIGSYDYIHNKSRIIINHSRIDSAIDSVKHM